MAQISSSQFISRPHRSSFFKTILLSISIFLFQQVSALCQSLSAEQIYKKVGSAVVTVNAYSDDGKLTSQVSGVVLNDSGWVITNYHILYKNNKIVIMNGKETVSFTDIIVVDPAKDLVIFKIKAKKFPLVITGNTKLLAIGDKVYAIGSSISKDSLISEGVITQLVKNEKRRSNSIQISAGIPLKNSGGAVLNDKGELIGISARVKSNNTNINLVIPVGDITTAVRGSYGKNDRFKDYEYLESGLQAFENEDYSLSRADLSEYIYRVPNDAVAYNYLGFSLNNTMNYSDAVQRFTKAIEIEPEYADAFYGRGIARQELHDYERAFSDYTKVIGMDSNNTSALINRAWVLVNLHKYNEAIRDLDKVLITSPENAKAYYYRAMTKDSLSMYSEALSDYKSAANYDTLYCRLYQVASKYVGKKYLSEGIRIYNLQNHHNFLQALVLFQKAIDIDHDAESYYWHGLCKYKLTDYNNALKDFDRAIELRHWDGAYFRMRGIIKFKLQDTNGAKVDWMRGSQLGDKESSELMMKASLIR